MQPTSINHFHIKFCSMIVNFALACDYDLTHFYVIQVKKKESGLSDVPFCLERLNYDSLSVLP